MPARYYNITGSTGVDVELLAPGSGVSSINAIMLTNTHATADATVSLFIQDNPTSGTTETYYIIKIYYHLIILLQLDTVYM